METNNNITRLLEMLENPEAYSEQEISDIINSDDDTREAYRMMVAARQGYNGRNKNGDDVDKAWRRIERSHLKVSFFHSPIRKMAAAIAALLVVSAIAFAAFSIARLKQAPPATQNATTTTNNTVRTNNQKADANQPDTARSRTASTEPVVFDNIPLEQMLTEIAAHYGADVEFSNDEARQLRFHFVWHREKGLDKVVDDLNHFESVDVALQGQHITVE